MFIYYIGTYWYIKYGTPNLPIYGNNIANELLLFIINRNMFPVANRRQKAIKPNDEFPAAVSDDNISSLYIVVGPHNFTGETACVINISGKF